MGKASRLKQDTTRQQKIAAQRAAARRAEVRNRVLIASISVVVVVAIVVTFVLVKVNSKSSTANGSTLTGAALTSLVSDVTTVPPSTLNAVGKGTAFAHIMISIPGSTLTSSGKPEVLYMGAEYCPYCATERWAMAVALSRFGTFSGVGAIHSSSSDQPASIPTLTFYKSSYTSSYLVFTPVEMQDVSKAALQAPTAQQQQLLNKYDAAPYTQSAGSIPFIDFGNKYMISGASYDYTVLQGKTWSQVAAALKVPSSAIAKGAVGTANVLSAAICSLTGNQPASVCTSAAVTAAKGQL